MNVASISWRSCAPKSPSCKPNAVKNDQASDLQIRNRPIDRRVRTRPRKSRGRLRSSRGRESLAMPLDAGINRAYVQPKGCEMQFARQQTKGRGAFQRMVRPPRPAVRISALMPNSTLSFGAGSMSLFEPSRSRLPDSRFASRRASYALSYSFGWPRLTVDHIRVVGCYIYDLHEERACPC